VCHTHKDTPTHTHTQMGKKLNSNDIWKGTTIAFDAIYKFTIGFTFANLIRPGNTVNPIVIGCHQGKWKSDNFYAIWFCRLSCKVWISLQKRKRIKQRKFCFLIKLCQSQLLWESQRYSCYVRSAPDGIVLRLSQRVKRIGGRRWENSRHRLNPINFYK